MNCNELAIVGKKSDQASAPASPYTMTAKNRLSRVASVALLGDWPVVASHDARDGGEQSGA